jgi:hypothetical protein
MSIASAAALALRRVEVPRIPALQLYKASSVESKQELFEFHRKRISVQKFAEAAEVDDPTARIMLRICYRVYRHHVMQIPNLSGNSEARFLALFILCYRWAFSLQMFWRDNVEPWTNESKFIMKTAETVAMSKVGSPEDLLFNKDASDAAMELRTLTRQGREILTNRSTQIETIPQKAISVRQLGRNPIRPVLEPPDQPTLIETKDAETLSDDGSSSSQSELDEAPLPASDDGPASVRSNLNGESSRRITRAMARSKQNPASDDGPSSSRSDLHEASPRRVTRAMANAAPVTARRQTEKKQEPLNEAPLSTRVLRNKRGDLFAMVNNPDKIGKPQRQGKKPQHEESNQQEESDTESEASTQDLDYERAEPVPRSSAMKRTHARLIREGNFNSLYTDLGTIQWIQQFKQSRFLKLIEESNAGISCHVEELPAGLFVMVQREPPYVVAIAGTCHETKTLEAWADTFQNQFESNVEVSPAQILPLESKQPYFVKQVHHPEELDTVVQWYSQLHVNGMCHGPCELMLVDGEIIISPPLGAGKAGGNYKTCSRYSILSDPSVKADWEMLVSLPCFDTAYGQYLRGLHEADRTLESLKTLSCQHCRLVIESDDVSYGYGVCENGHLVHAKPIFAEGDDLEPSLVENCNEESVAIGDLVCLECQSHVNIVFKPDRGI